MTTPTQQPAAVPLQAPEDMESKLQSMMESARTEAEKEEFTEVNIETLTGSDEERPNAGDEIMIYRFAERDVEAGIPAVSKLKVAYRMTVSNEKTYIVNGSYKSANYRNSRCIGNNILVIRAGTVMVFTGRGSINLKHANHPGLIFIKKAPNSPPQAGLVKNVREANSMPTDGEVQATANATGGAASSIIQ